MYTKDFLDTTRKVDSFFLPFFRMEVCCFRRTTKRKVGCPFTLNLIGETSRSRLITFAMILVTFLFAFQSLFFGNVFENMALNELRGGGGGADASLPESTTLITTALTRTETTSIAMSNGSTDTIFVLFATVNWTVQVGTIILFLFCVSVSNSTTQHPLVSIGGILSIILLVRNNGKHTHTHTDFFF